MNGPGSPISRRSGPSDAVLSPPITSAIASARGRMDFRILGPLEVHNDSGTVALGGAKPRAVLAMLLLHANQPVSAEQLALALWGEEAPAGSVKTVQVHVSRVRK